MATVIVESKSPSDIVTPAGGTVELFRDATNNNHMSYMDSNRNVVDLEAIAEASSSSDSDDAECCACKIQEHYWCQITSALNKGMLTAAQFTSLVTLGFSTNAAEVEDNLGNKVCSVNSGPLAVAVVSISVSPSTTDISVAATQQLTTTFTPTNPSNTGLIYVSSNTAVATVSSTGLITGIGAGTATIYVYSAADLSKVDTCVVTVS